MKKSNIIITSSGLINYGKILDHKDPFAFLATLKSGEIAEDDFDPASLASKRLTTNGQFDMDLISKEIDIAKMVRSVLDENALVPKDVKIDDGDFPLAKNIYDWVSKDTFAGTVITPFIEQLIWGVILFAEYCVAEGSYLHTGKGIVRIEDFLGNPTSTGMKPFKSKLVTENGPKFTSHGGMTSKRRKCLKITYANGHSITVTPEHRVRTLESDLSFGWKQASELHVGEFGVMRYGTNLWPSKPYVLKPYKFERTKISRTYSNGTEATTGGNHRKTFKQNSVVTPELARLTGYLVSDGRIQKNSIGFINTDIRVVEDFIHCCSVVFQETPSAKRGTKPNSTKEYYTVSLHGRHYVDYLYHIGFVGNDCYTKQVPNYILQSDKECVVDFLRSVFDCDGYVDSNRVGITLASPECVEQIHLLMQNLGIYGNLKKFNYDHTNNEAVTIHRELDDYKNLRGSWICKSTESILLYKKEIGSIHEDKLTNLNNIKAKERNAALCYGNIRPGSIPFCKELYKYAQSLRDSYHAQNFSRTKFRRRDACEIDSMLNDSSFVSFFEQFDSKVVRRLEKLKDVNNAYSQIVSISDAGFHEVYDVTVPDGENFLCNGVVVHNCPDCSDMEYLFHTHNVNDSIPYFLRKVQMLDHGVCPACKGRKSKFVNQGKMNFYQEIAVQAGQRSGKTAVVGGVFTPYMTHRILKMQKPCDVYGVASSTMLHGTFCALTYAQAKETLWEFYYGTLCTSEWFKGYHQMLQYYENKYGQSLLKLNDTFVVYRPRNLMWYPAGPDKRILRGRTRIMGGVDEIGYFDNDAASNKVKTSAHHVYDALDASLLTIRGAANRLLRSGFDNILTGFGMNVSSPVSQRDKICTLVRQARGSKTMYGIHRPTWEVNPNFPRDEPSIVDAYQRNPGDAERNFGANPPLVANPFLSNTEYISRAFSKKKSNPIQIRDVIKNKKRTGNSNKWAEVIKLKQGIKPSMLTIDAGVTFNSFAITVLSFDENKGKIRGDLFCEVIPEPGIPLNYTMIYEQLITPIIRQRNVKCMLADRWNSIKILSDVEADFGIVAEQYSLKYKDMSIARSHLEAGSIIFPKRETEIPVEDLMTLDSGDYPACFKGRPMDHFALQLQTVQDTGLQVIKGDGLTDDLWRALALGVYGMSTDKYAELLVGDAPKRAAITTIGVSRLGSGGGGATSSDAGGTTSNLGVLVRGR